MIRFKFKSVRGVGAGISSAIRQMLIEKSETVKPVAFSMSDGSQFKDGNSIIGSMDLTAKLAELRIADLGVVTFPFVVNINKTGCITSKDLEQSGGISVLDDKILLESIEPNKALGLSVIFDKGYGYRSTDVVRRELSRQSINLDGYYVIACRHTDITVDAEIEEGSNHDLICLEVESKTGDEKLKTQMAIEELIEKLQEIKENI